MITSQEWRRITESQNGCGGQIILFQTPDIQGMVHPGDENLIKFQTILDSELSHMTQKNDLTLIIGRSFQPMQCSQYNQGDEADSLVEETRRLQFSCLDSKWLRFMMSRRQRCVMNVELLTKLHNPRIGGHSLVIGRKLVSDR